MTAAGPDGQYVLEQYETLRREALASAPGAPRGQGLALFLTRGMPAWLTALAALTPAPRRRDDAPGEPPAPFLPTLRADLTSVLAGMVLACTPSEEARA